MKLALIFLSALVAITQQQFQQQQPSGRPWWSPYSYQQLPSIVGDRREIYYNNFQEYDIPSIRRFRPVRPVPYFPQNVELDPSFVADDYYYQDDSNAEEEFPDMHSRKKVAEIRYRPFSNTNQAQQQQRFFSKIYSNYYSSLSSILTKTATFTLTSTVSLTTVQSCIAAANFLDAAAQTTPCRRKRDILENAPGDNTQFLIAPSQAQRVMPTALASLDVIRENRQLPVDDQISGSMSSEENLRVKRFLNYSVTSVTVTTYSFLSATVTKTVAIGGAAAVLCLPSGWAVC